MSDRFSPSLSSRDLSVFPCFYRRNAPSVLAERSSLPVEQQPQSCDNNTGARRRFHREAERGARLRGCGAAGCRGSVLGGLVPGLGFSRCPLDLQRQRCCCNLTAPPLITTPANHSPENEPSRAPIGRQACQSPESAT